MSAPLRLPSIVGLLLVAQAAAVSLPHVNAAGETVGRLRASDGALYDVDTDTAGKILRSARVAG